MAELPAPAELAWLADIIGDDATLALIEAHGGTRLYVPRRSPAASRLAEVLGAAAVGQLSATWGGDYLKVPTAKFWRARILRARGKSYAEIARALGATESSVWRWLNAAGDTATGQPELRLWG
jgi:hypothetical protein